MPMFRVTMMEKVVEHIEAADLNAAGRYARESIALVTDGSLRLLSVYPYESPSEDSPGRTVRRLKVVDP